MLWMLLYRAFVSICLCLYEALFACLRVSVRLSEHELCTHTGDEKHRCLPGSPAAAVATAAAAAAAVSGLASFSEPTCS